MRPLRAVDALLAPSRCVLCRRRINVGQWCVACTAITRVPSRLCYRCGSSRASRHICWPDNSPVTSTTVAYDDSLGLRRALAVATRYGVAGVFDQAAHVLAQRYVVRLGRPTVVCCLPLPRQAQRVQSMNQRQQVAVAFAREARLPFGPRLKLVQGVQRCGAPEVALYDTNVVLVTDVIDADPMLAAAVRALDEADVHLVDVVAVARFGDDMLA